MSTWINEATGRREYAPVSLDGINADLAHRAALRRADQVRYASVNSRRPPFIARHAGCVPCHACEGLGFTQENHGYDHGLGVVDCHRCGGTGLKE